MKIIVATNNQSKLAEIKRILNEYEILSLKDINYNQLIIENGNSYYENAYIKAKAVFDFYHNNCNNCLYLADDSGLEIEALDGKPGINSSIYAGENSTQEMLINKVLIEMKNVPYEKRKAKFVCIIVLIDQNGNVFQSDGFCKGYINYKPIGYNGFGYDPIFMPIEYNNRLSMAELTDREKDLISHRGKALSKIKEIIKKIIKD